MVFDINSLFDANPSFLQNKQDSNSIANYKSSEKFKFNAFRQETQDITLTTDEGDVVTISSKEQLQASYLSFDYSGIKKGEAFHEQGENFQTSAKNDFQISVEGDLNAEEQEDIARVLSRLDGLMENLVGGDLDAVMKDALGIIDDTETISSIDAVLQFKQQVAMEYQSITQTSGRQGNHFMPPSEHNAGETEGLNQKILDGANLIAKLTGKMMDIIYQSQAETADLKKPLNTMFKEYMDKALQNTDDPQNQLKADLLQQLQENTDMLLS